MGTWTVKLTHCRPSQYCLAPILHLALILQLEDPQKHSSKEWSKAPTMLYAEEWTSISTLELSGNWKVTLMLRICASFAHWEWVSAPMVMRSPNVNSWAHTCAWTTCHRQISMTNNVKRFHTPCVRHVDSHGTTQRLQLSEDQWWSISARMHTLWWNIAWGEGK